MAAKEKLLILAALALGACTSNLAVDGPGVPIGRGSVTAFNDAQWSDYQQVFTLSMLSNKAANQTGTAQSLETFLASQLDGQTGGALTNPSLQQLIGTWTVAWGPAVYQDQASGSSVADNAMYVAKDQAGDTYVVAIAGTNPASTYDLFTEDADVGTPVAWPFGNAPAGTMISEGTEDGVNALLGMTDPESGLTLAAFLAQIQSSSTTLVFAGHSLGGALAPTLALALVGNGQLQVGDWANVHVYPTAGPTPGNAAFVSFFSSVFPATGSGIQAWNNLVWNSLDIVPHAWNTTTLAAFPTLYDPSLPPSPCVTGIASALGQEVASDGYAQLPSQGALTGTYQATLPPSYPPATGTYATTIQFVEQAFYQHIEGYFDLLGVDQLLPAPVGIGIFQVPTPPQSIGPTLAYLCSKQTAGLDAHGQPPASAQPARP